MTKFVWLKLQGKAKEKNQARFCNSLQKSASNGEKFNRHTNINSSVALDRAEQVAHNDHQDFLSLHDKVGTLSHVAPENRSGTKRSGLSSPEDFLGKKVSHKKKYRAPRENDSLFGASNLEHKQHGNHRAGQDRDAIIGENDYCYGTFSTTDFSQFFTTIIVLMLCID